MCGDAGFERELDRLPLQRRLAQVDLAHEAVERFELFDRVALDAGAQRLSQHRVEIDEAFGAQQPIELVTARRVAAHELLERGRLVVAEVIDVHAGIGRPRLHDGVDRGLERRALLGVGEGPLGGGGSSGRSGRRPGRPDSTTPHQRPPAHSPNEILPSAIPREACTLQIEKQIAGRRLRQPRQALTFDDLEQLVNRTAFDSLAMLQPRLLCDACIRVARAARRLERDRHGHRGRRGQRRMPMLRQFLAMQPGDARDERQMVVATAPRVAVQLPAADVTRLHGLGIVVAANGVVTQRPASRAN